MPIGSFGSVVFEVSSEKVFTFDEMTRGGSAVFAKHEVIGGKPLLEFTGPELETISYNILLCSELGVDPAKEIEALREIRDTGKADCFILDGRPQGVGMWVITDLQEEHDHIDRDGAPATIRAALTMEEYVEME